MLQIIEEHEFKILNFSNYSVNQAFKHKAQIQGRRIDSYANRMNFIKKQVVSCLK